MPRANSHTCPAPGCVAVVHDSALACREHWFELPRPIRGRINRWYFIGQTAATMSPQYREALADAQAFWEGRTAL